MSAVERRVSGSRGAGASLLAGGLCLRSVLAVLVGVVISLLVGSKLPGRVSSLISLDVLAPLAPLPC